jgi:5-methylcytosine-specific restriction endonuclease McrA
MSKKTPAMINKENFLAEGKNLPICANIGCTNDINVRDWKNYSFRHQCSRCINHLKKGLPAPEGVSFLKKDYCENKDARLGFTCPVNPQYKFPNNVLHGDHIDGNHENNIPENLQTLCSICHAQKGLLSGDFNSAKKGRKLS